MQTVENTIIRASELSNVAEQHHRGIFGNFPDVIEARISELRKSPNPENAELVRFFEYLLTEVNGDDYDAVRKHYLSRSNGDPDNGFTKYLDPIVWFESKLRIARRLDLHKRPPLRILDIGTGPGHFAVVARFYGHDVTGTDLPVLAPGGETEDHLYDALCGLYRVNRIRHVIRPMQRVSGLDGRYDLVTAFLAAFNVDEQRQPWSVQHWQFFLADLRQGVLTGQGSLFMILANRKLTSESWDYLVSLADRSDEPSKQILISAFPPPP